MTWVANPQLVQNEMTAARAFAGTANVKLKARIAGYAGDRVALLDRVRIDDFRILAGAKTQGAAFENFQADGARVMGKLTECVDFTIKFPNVVHG